MRRLLRTGPRDQAGREGGGGAGGGSALSPLSRLGYRMSQ